MTETETRPEVAYGAPSSGGRQGPHDAYREAGERHDAVLERVDAEIRRVETARLISFLVAGIVGLLYADLPIGAAPALTIAGVATMAFVALVVWHRRLRRVQRRARVGRSLARVGRARLWREWDEITAALADVGYEDPLFDADAERDEAHPYSEDLDLFGRASVRALFGPTPTPTGVATLRHWLKDRAEPSEIAARQSAVRALAADFEGREALATEALLVERSDEREWRTLRAWLAGDGVALPGWALPVSVVLPALTSTFFVLDVGLGFALPPVTWVLPLVVQSWLASRWARANETYLGLVTSGALGIRRYEALFAAWERYEHDEATLRSLQARLRGEGRRAASEEIRRFERWVDSADSRASMFYLLFAWGFLTDVHILRGLERWRRGAGAHLEDWLDALGELEASAALAVVAHDHPEWCWPEVVDGEPRLEAEALGHPLLPESVLRTSDVSVDPPGRFLLVTGSNMSGKSTLLRSIGLAAVMAQAGSVVCARRLVVSPLRTFTSMRIHDSLTAGVSLFMAELNRLKALVDAADAEGEDAALLYLVDEVLQGTNSEERRVAARRIVAHLLDVNAIGAVTTHDLALHEEARIDDAATKVHFREHVGGGEGGAVLTFDYLLRPGLATSRNALKLLEIVGLGDVAPESEG